MTSSSSYPYKCIYNCSVSNKSKLMPRHTQLGLPKAWTTERQRGEQVICCLAAYFLIMLGHLCRLLSMPQQLIRRYDGLFTLCGSQPKFSRLYKILDHPKRQESPVLYTKTCPLFKAAQTLCRVISEQLALANYNKQTTFSIDFGLSDEGDVIYYATKLFMSRQKLYFDQRGSKVQVLAKQSKCCKCDIAGGSLNKQNKSWQEDYAL